MRASYFCPHCQKETDYLNKELKFNEENPIKKSKYYIVHRIKDIDGKIVWKNLFRMRIVDVMFVITLIVLLFGFWQINNQCKEYLADPCGYAATTNQCVVIKSDEFIPSYEPTNFKIPARDIPPD